MLELFAMKRTFPGPSRAQPVLSGPPGLSHRAGAPNWYPGAPPGLLGRVLPLYNGPIRPYLPKAPNCPPYGGSSRPRRFAVSIICNEIGELPCAVQLF